MLKNMPNKKQHPITKAKHASALAQTMPKPGSKRYNKAAKLFYKLTGTVMGEWR
jgi:hypothetical protein